MMSLPAHSPPARLVRSRSCKNKRPSGYGARTGSDSDGSPELVTASAKRRKCASKSPQEVSAKKVSSEVVCRGPVHHHDQESASAKPASLNRRVRPRTLDSAKVREENRRPPCKATPPPSVKTSRCAEQQQPQQQQRRSGKGLLMTVNGAVSDRRGANMTIANEMPATQKTLKGELISAQREEPATIEEDCLPGTFVSRDVWTVKYAPSAYGSFIGNATAVQQLEEWLKQWKDPVKRNIFSDCDSNSSVRETLSNAMLIRGPPGVGKTALVYYVAHRLGYTVLEVNSSSERPGRRVLADLQEATQSGHVEGTKVSSASGISSFFKPTLSATTPSSKAVAVEGAGVSTTPVSASSASRNKRNPKGGRETPGAGRTPRGTLAQYFTSKREPTTAINLVCEDDDLVSDTKTETPSAADDPRHQMSSIKTFFKTDKTSSNATSTAVAENAKKQVAAMRTSLSPVIETTSSCLSAAVRSDQKIKCSNSTIILFDDVDVIFDDDGDEGFWMALETVLKSSKKPCILTATQGYEAVVKRCRILQNAPLIDLHRPSPSQVAALVKKICIAEERDLTDYNVEFMCQYLASDVRRSLLQMDFETVSPGLTQTIYPANKTLAGLLASGYIDDALAIQTAYKKIGFNALYASLEDCLPFNFEGEHKARTSDVNVPAATTKPIKGQHRASSFNKDTLRDLSEVFDVLSECDLFTGALDRIGENHLPSYERAKRWMERLPMERLDTSPRAVEELLEIEAFVLIRKAVTPFNRISERFAALDPYEQQRMRFSSVSTSLGFYDIHKQLKKVKVCERSITDVLGCFAIGRPLVRDYVAFLARICVAEDERKQVARRGNRLGHYLYHVGIALGPEQITRLASYWQGVPKMQNAPLIAQAPTAST